MLLPRRPALVRHEDGELCAPRRATPRKGTRAGCLAKLASPKTPRRTQQQPRSRPDTKPHSECLAAVPGHGRSLRHVHGHLLLDNLPRPLPIGYGGLLALSIRSGFDARQPSAWSVTGLTRKWSTDYPGSTGHPKSDAIATYRTDHDIITPSIHHPRRTLGLLRTTPHPTQDKAPARRRLRADQACRSVAR